MDIDSNADGCLMTSLKHKNRVEKIWNETKWKQAVILIRKDAYEHRLRLRTIIEKWMASDRMSGILTEKIIRDIVFYRVGRWVSEYDLIDGDEGFC